MGGRSLRLFIRYPYFVPSEGVSDSLSISSEVSVGSSKVNSLIHELSKAAITAGAQESSDVPILVVMVNCKMSF